MQEKNMGHICPIGRSGVKTEKSLKMDAGKKGSFIMQMFSQPSV